MHVQLQHEIAVRLESPRHAVGEKRGKLAWRPAEKVAVGKAPRHDETIEAGPGIGLVQQARGRRFVDAHVGVVHDARVAGTKLDAAHVSRAGHGDGNHEVPQHV